MREMAARRSSSSISRRPIRFAPTCAYRKFTGERFTPDWGRIFEVSQYPGDDFQGKVVRTADAIDLASRTLNTEVDVPNKDGCLLPGGYAQVHLLVKVTGQRLQVPVNALLFRSEGLRAVIIDENHKTHLQAIAIGRDYGTALEVSAGSESHRLDRAESAGFARGRTAGERERNAEHRTTCRRESTPAGSPRATR